MYCKKCGKFVGNNATYCDDCLKQEGSVFGISASNQTYTYNPVSLGKPIAAAVLSFVGLFLIYIGVIAISELMGYNPTYYEIDYSLPLGLIIVGAIPCLIGLILGIGSIAHFKATSHVKSGKRIPVLILGISSVAVSALMLVCAFLMLVAVGMMV